MVMNLKSNGNESKSQKQLKGATSALQVSSSSPRCFKTWTQLNWTQLTQLNQIGLETKPNQIGLKAKPNQIELETQPNQIKLETKPNKIRLETRPNWAESQTKPNWAFPGWTRPASWQRWASRPTLAPAGPPSSPPWWTWAAPCKGPCWISLGGHCWISLGG